MFSFALASVVAVATLTLVAWVRGRAAASLPPSTAALNVALADEVRALLQAERALEAIKLVRARTGLGLRAAKEAVEAVQRGEALPPHSVAPRHLDEAEVLRLINESRVIDAIKLVRTQTGLGLKEAKDLVEALKQR